MSGIRTRFIAFAIGVVAAILLLGVVETWLVVDSVATRRALDGYQAQRAADHAQQERWHRETYELLGRVFQLLQVRHPPPVPGADDKGGDS